MQYPIRNWLNFKFQVLTGRFRKVGYSCAACKEHDTYYDLNREGRFCNTCCYFEPDFTEEDGVGGNAGGTPGE